MYSNPPRTLHVHGALVTLSLVAIGLRLPGLNADLWRDEAITVGVAQHGAHITSLLKLDGSPPLFYVLLTAWGRVFGFTPVSVHLLSVSLGLLVIPVGAWVGWMIGRKRGAFCAAALMATSPLLVTYSGEVRPYGLFALLACVSLGLVIKIDQGDRRWVTVVALALSEAGCLYTHVWGAFYVAALTLTVCVSAGRTHSLGQARRFCAAAGLAGLLFLPWLPTLLYQRRHTAAPWLPSPDLSTLGGTSFALSGNKPSFVLVAVFGLFLAAQMIHQKRQDRAVQIVLGSIVGTLGFGLLVSIVVQPVWVMRYTIVVLPALLIGIVLAGQRHRFGEVLLALLVLTFVTQDVINVDSDREQKTVLAGLVRQITSDVDLGNRLTVISTFLEVPTLSYAFGQMDMKPVFVDVFGVESRPYMTDWRDSTARVFGVDPEKTQFPAPTSTASVLVIMPNVFAAEETTWSRRLASAESEFAQRVFSELAPELSERWTHRGWSAVLYRPARS